jgi:hypothetical protein
MRDFINWRDSGTCYTRKAFSSKFPTVKLLGACEDVMLYDGGYFIQGLFDGSWYECNTNRSKDIEEVEKTLFLEKVSPSN